MASKGRKLKEDATASIIGKVKAMMRYGHKYLK
jgi:hypothetical protein